MRTAFALLLACLLMVIGCTSTEQAAESGALGPAVEEGVETEAPESGPSEPYVQGDDLSEWVTVDEAGELIREFAARYEVDLSGEDARLFGGTRWYHCVVGEFDPMLGHWGIEMTSLSPEDLRVFEGEESELLPDGVLARHTGMAFGEYYFRVSDEQGLIVRLYSGGPMPSPPDTPVELSQDEWRVEVFRVATAVLKEMGWAS